MAASFIHVLPRLPFYLRLELYSSCESAVAPFPCLPRGKVLAAVIGIRSLPSEGMVDRGFLQSRGAFFSSKFFWGVLPLVGYGNRPLKLSFYPLTSPWAGLIIEDLWQIALNEFWALQQTGCCTVVLGHRGLLCLGLLPPACFGLTADAFCVGCFNLP